MKLPFEKLITVVKLENQQLVIYQPTIFVEQCAEAKTFNKQQQQPRL